MLQISNMQGFKYMKDVVFTKTIYSGYFSFFPSFLSLSLSVSISFFLSHVDQPRSLSVFCAFGQGVTSELWHCTAWLEILILPFTSYVNLGRLFNLLVFQILRM